MDIDPWNALHRAEETPARNLPSIEDFRSYRDACAAIIGGADASAAAVSTSRVVNKERTWLSKWLPRFCQLLEVEGDALIRLPERRTERITITPAGRNLLEATVKFLGSYTELMRATEETPSEITIGTWHWFSLTILSRAAPLFQERLHASPPLAGRPVPPVGLRVYEYDSAEMMRDLNLGLLDLAFGGTTNKFFTVEGAYPDLEPVKPMLQVRMPLVAISPKGYDWKRRPLRPSTADRPGDEVGMEELADELTYLVRYDLDDWLPQLPSRSSSGCRVLVTHYIGVLAAVLASGKAPPSRPRVVGIVPQFGVRRSNGSVWDGGTMSVGELDVFPLRGVPPAELNLWCKSPHKPSPTMRLFEQCVRDVVAEIWEGIPIPPTPPRAAS